MGGDIGFSMSVDASQEARLDQALARLPVEIVSKEVPKAAAFAMTPVLKEMRARAPGVIGENLAKKRKIYRATGTTVVIIGPVSKTIIRQKADGSVERVNPANIAHLVEKGTAPHLISARFQGGALKIGGIVVAGTVMHPGARPNPFGAQTYQSQRHNVVRRYTDKLLRGLETQVRKLGGGTHG